MESILSIALCMGAFAATDRVIAWKGFQNPYYAVHAIHNALIVAFSLPDVIRTFTEFHDLHRYSTNWTVVYLCCALHIYHVLVYWRSLRFDDWLHHILMIGIAIPVSCATETNTFMGMNLFFTTGLPGGIDYVLLFGARNGYVRKELEKQVNTWLNVWVRSPGCTAMAALSAAYILSNGTDAYTWARFIAPVLTYWNGQYFMQQIVTDSARIGWTKNVETI